MNSQNTDLRLTNLQPSDLPRIAEYWRRAHPWHPLDPTMLRERLFEWPGGGGELNWGAVNPEGELIGLVAGVEPWGTEPGWAGVRWLGVDPAWPERGVEKALLDKLESILRARGVRHVKMIGTPPYYIRPGVDTRDTALVATLLTLGWEHERTLINMTVDLATWPQPAREEIFGAFAGGYEIRPAQPADREPFDAYMRAHWTDGWRREALQGLDRDPVSLFLAFHDGQIIGFSACEVSQCMGSFGPTGLLPEHRGRKLGQRLLWACLARLKQLGRPVCEIGWVGPVHFYWRHARAHIGPHYMLLNKTL